MHKSTPHQLTPATSQPPALHKQAENPAVAQATQEAIRQILTTGAGAFSIGAALRALRTPRDIISPRLPMMSPIEAPVVVPLTARSAQEDEARLRDKRKPLSWVNTTPGAARLKLGSEPALQGAAPEAPAAPLFSEAAKAIHGGLQRVGAAGALEMPVPGTTAPRAKGFYWPGIMLAASGGAVGGYNLLDWIQNKRRENAEQAALGDADDEYQQALHELRSLRQKSAADAVATPASAPLPFSLRNMAGALAGYPLAVATATGVPSALLAYRYVRGNNDRKALRDAIYLRRRALQAQRPPTIMAVPASDTI